MGYIDDLRLGSDFHSVTPTSGRGFTIRAANKSEACLDAFHDIVDTAIEKAPAEGYEIKNPHASSMDGKGRWDFASITVAE